jgi:hypothetical protein
LRDQPLLVQKVARKAIESTTLDFFLKCAWQNDGASRLTFGKPILLEAAKALQGEYPDVKDITASVTSDELYATALSYIVRRTLILQRYTLILFDSLLTASYFYELLPRLLVPKLYRSSSLALVTSARRALRLYLRQRSMSFQDPGGWLMVKRRTCVGADLLHRLRCANIDVFSISVGMGAKCEGTILKPCDYQHPQRRLLFLRPRSWHTLCRPFPS